MDTRIAEGIIRQRCVPDGECIVWTGAKDGNGYGLFGREGRTYRAHRVSLELKLGRPLGSLHALHTCDRPECVNPEHLYAGTPGDNARDREARNRGSKVRVQGSRVVTAKLSEEQIPLIRAHLAAGATHASIAQELGVNRDTIGAIARGESWRHVP